MEYSTALAAIVLDEIEGALRSGMSAEKAYIEMIGITRLLQQRIIDDHIKRKEASPCFAD